MSEHDELIEDIKEAAKRSAWVRVFSDFGSDNDSISRDPVLLRLNWSDEQAKVMEDYFAKKPGVTQAEAHYAFDRGILSYNSFIDIFFEEKNRMLTEIKTGKAK